MSGVVERLVAIGVAATLALNPITGVHGRVPSSICGKMPEGVAWDEKGNAPLPPFQGVKPCHVCLPDKRKPRPGCPDPSHA